LKVKPTLSADYGELFEVAGEDTVHIGCVPSGNHLDLGMIGRFREMLQKSVRAGATEHAHPTARPASCRQRWGYDTPSFFTPARKELNMGQALHVEPKQLMQREILTLEFSGSDRFQVFGKVQLLHCRPKHTPGAFPAR
jgi:hypothetical protein